MARYEAVTGNKYIVLRLDVTETSTDISSNTSTVNWTLSVAKSASSTDRTWGNCSYSVSINGEGHSGSKSVSVSPNGTDTLLSGTTTVAHDSDGNKTISVSGSISGKISGSVSGSLTLSSIGRASSLGVSGNTIGSAVTLTITAADSNFRHAVTFTYGTYYTTILSNVLPGTYTWTPELTICNQVPNGTSLTGTLYISTWYSGNFVADKSFSYTLNVPDSVKPTISSVDYFDTEGCYAKYGALVQHKSKVRVVTKASGTYGSSLQRYYITMPGYSTVAGSSDYTGDWLRVSGSQKISVQVMDSRQRWSDSNTNTLNILAYSAPTVTKLTTFRCDKDGTANSEGEYITVVYGYSITPLNDKNKKEVTIEYKRSTGTSWTTMKTLTDSYSASGSFITSDPISNDYQYDLRITVTDDFTSTQYTTIIPSAAVVFDILTSGDGAAFGKTSETANLLDIAWNVAIGGSTMSDFVVASGTSGGWDYIKFANGIAACWRRVAFSGASIGTQVGNIYMSGMIMGAMAYPFTFAEVPNELVTANCDGKFVWPALASVNTNTNASTLRLAAPVSYNTSSTAVSGAFSVFTIGRWK